MFFTKPSYPHPWRLPQLMQWQGDIHAPQMPPCQTQLSKPIHNCMQISYLWQKWPSSYMLNYQRPPYGTPHDHPPFLQKKCVNDLLYYRSPFVINPYDPCVANITITRKQVSITRHLDDIKVTRVHPVQITINLLWQWPNNGSSKSSSQLPWHGSKFCFRRNCPGVEDYIQVRNIYQLLWGNHHVVCNPSSQHPITSSRLPNYSSCIN